LSRSNWRTFSNDEAAVAHPDLKGLHLKDQSQALSPGMVPSGFERRLRLVEDNPCGMANRWLRAMRIEELEQSCPCYRETGSGMKDQRLEDKVLLHFAKMIPCLACVQEFAWQHGDQRARNKFHEALWNQIETAEPACLSDPDHVTSRGAGGDDVAENVWTLCRRHHVERHNEGPRHMALKYPVLMPLAGSRGTHGYLERGFMSYIQFADRKELEEGIDQKKMTAGFVSPDHRVYERSSSSTSSASTAAPPEVFHALQELQFTINSIDDHHMEHTAQTLVEAAEKLRDEVAAMKKLLKNDAIEKLRKKDRAE
jgi:hypothetical protein